MVGLSIATESYKDIAISSTTEDVEVEERKNEMEEKTNEVKAAFDELSKVKGVVQKKQVSFPLPLIIFTAHRIVCKLNHTCYYGDTITTVLVNFRGQNVELGPQQHIEVFHFSHFLTFSLSHHIFTIQLHLYKLTNVMLTESDGKKFFRGELFAMGPNGLTYRGTFEKDCPGRGDVMVLGMGNKATDLIRVQEGQKALSPGYEFLTLSPDKAEGRKTHLEMRFQNAASFQNPEVVDFFKVSL